MPENAPEAASFSTHETNSPSKRPRKRLRNRVLWFCFIIFTFEVGVFLLIFPWMDTWNLNSIQAMAPGLGHVWDDPYFRGAVSGLGVVNIYFACLESVRLFRRA